MQINEANTSKDADKRTLGKEGGCLCGCQDAHGSWQQFSINHLFLMKGMPRLTKSLWHTFSAWADNVSLCLLIMYPDFFFCLLENQNGGTEGGLEHHVGPRKPEPHQSFNLSESNTKMKPNLSWDDSLAGLISIEMPTRVCLSWYLSLHNDVQIVLGSTIVTVQ